jgi:hypothetical protein
MKFLKRFKLNFWLAFVVALLACAGALAAFVRSLFTHVTSAATEEVNLAWLAHKISLALLAFAGRPNVEVCR